ncbi:MAG: hypothetical protein ABGX15_14595, partial [Paracoccaceae bacterium]
MHLLKRRAVLRGALSSLALAATPGLGAGRPERIAAIDWAMLETALALGVTPVAACELIRFRADAIEPPVPETVTDLGLRGSPNFELLQLTRPTMILTSPWYAQIAPCNYPQLSGGGVARRAPSTRSARREKPRQITVVPGGASEARS